MSEQTKTEETKVIDIKPGDVRRMLTEGKTRKEIGAFYGLNRTNTAELFKDPRLKGMKTKNVGGTTFNLVDDGTEPVKSHAKAKKADGEATKKEDVVETKSENKAPAAQEGVTAAVGENW